MNPHQQAALALHAGDAIGALQAVALRDDPRSLAMRATAMARMGDLARARILFERAERGFAGSDRLGHARCLLARAELQLAMRDGGWPAAELLGAHAIFREQGDTWNATYLKLVEARRAIMLGRLDEAETILAVHGHGGHPVLRAIANLLGAHLFFRQLRIGEARTALARASGDLEAGGPEALRMEVLRMHATLRTPFAGRRSGKDLLPLLPDALCALNQSVNLIVDATRFEVRHRESAISLVTRPVLFSLLSCLATAWPGECRREDLIGAVFRGRQVDESYRARLRVEMLRLRRLLGAVGSVVATAGGYRLVPDNATAVVMIEPLAGTRHAQLLALLGDGEAWTSLAVAEALGASRRTAQRSLEALSREGLVRKQGAGSAQRWRAPGVDPIALAMLLPAAGNPAV